MDKNKKPTQEPKKEITAVPTEAPKELMQAVQMSTADLQEQYGDMGSDDVAIPRLVVLQALSPEVSDGRGRAGDFFIKGLERNLGSNPIEIIAVMRSKSRIYWKDLKQGGGILCRSFDAKIGVGEPGGNCDACPLASREVVYSDAPSCDIYQNLLVVIRTDEDWFPMALSGNRTKLKPLKNFNSLLMVELAKGRPMFSKSYKLEAVQQSNNQGMRYFNYRISPTESNAVLPESEQLRALTIYQSLKGKTINIHQDQDATTDTPDHKDF